MHEYDTMFSFPSIDAEPDTELGVLLMGLGPERLLAGLGVAAGGDADPVTVTQVVDQLRHDARPDLPTPTATRPTPTTMAAALAAGVARWLVVRPTLRTSDAGGVRSAAMRQMWEAALRTVTLTEELFGPVGRAERVYLTVCWLRRVEIDEILEVDRCRT